MWVQSRKERIVTATWLKAWDLVGQQANPPNTGRIPNRLAYLRHHAIDMAYIAPPGPDETHRHFIERLYNTLQQMATAGRETLKMRVFRKYPVWRNLHTFGVSEEIRFEWYSAIHDIIPRNIRLAAIHLMDTDVCRQGGKPDILTHRLTECADGTAIWGWTRHQVAMMLRTDPRHVSTEWIFCPHFHLWPPQRQRATLWTLAHLVWYRTQGRGQSLADYIGYMRRSRWKEHQ
jgi:hypothetical protein